jgi:L,D-transpeptidase ErfK/SrfK
MKMKTKIIATITAAALILLFLIIPREAMSLTRYGEMLCQEDGYTCLKVPKGSSWESLFPNENQRAIVMRLNRMNERIHGGMIIVVPENLANVDYMKLTPMETNVEPTGYKRIIVDPNAQAFGAYDENGNLVRWGPASLGRDWCPDIHIGCRSKAGAFKVYEKRGEGCFSSKFPVPDGGAPMPYCMFFNRGYAIHASELPGYNASHGCIRVFYEDAEWLNHEFASVGTPVVVRPYET